MQEELKRQEEERAASAQHQDEQENSQDESPFRDSFADEFENEGLCEAEKTYKKLRKMLLLISNFYKSGLRTKTESSKGASESLVRMRVDEQMAKKQLETLESNNAWKGLLKFNDLKTAYTDDVTRIAEEIKILQTHVDSSTEAIVRTKKITTCCEYLTANFDSYCGAKIANLPESVVKSLQPETPVNKEQIADHLFALELIGKSVTEAKDFFESALNGGLEKYYRVEKLLLESQLQVLQKYDASSKRKLIQESEMKQDLEFAKQQLAQLEDEKTRTRRQRLVAMFNVFLEALNWFTQKLQTV